MLKVVLADDEKKILLLLQKLIDWERLGYEIVGTANDGLRALELVRELHPDLLITDVRMPGCSGIELIQQAKELQPDLHFIIISGYRQFEYAQNALKYGVEDYLLKPLKKEELTGILMRLSDKLGEEAALEFQLKRSKERQQDLLMESLGNAAEHQQPFLAYADEGFYTAEGVCFAAVVRVDLIGTIPNPDGYQVILRSALEIVRRELHSLTDVFAASIRKEGVAVVLRMSAYRTVALKQCFTKIQKEIEQQRDLFGNLRCTICLGSRQTDFMEMVLSMRQAMWFCQDRLCHPQSWRDAETEQPEFRQRYMMEAAQKKRLQVAAECLDAARFAQELE